MSALLYHLVPAAVWHGCVTAQSQYFPETYEKDGFIHLTRDSSLLLEVANHFYKDIQGDYIVLVIDESKLESEVKNESAADVGEKKTKRFGDGEREEVQVFPHLYGTINFDSVTRELSVQRDPESGSFLSIEELNL